MFLLARASDIPIRVCFNTKRLNITRLWPVKRQLSLQDVILWQKAANPCCTKGTKGGSSGTSKHQLTFEPYKAPPKLQHDAKNMQLKRPMSPHLTIYAPTLPAMTSIVQRITGVIIFSYAMLMAGGSLFLTNGVETYVSMIQSLDLSRPLIFTIKIMLGAPFVYHYFNGIRFVMWNFGKWLAIKEVYDTAKKSFIATAVLTVLFAFL